MARKEDEWGRIHVGNTDGVGERIYCCCCRCCWLNGEGFVCWTFGIIVLVLLCCYCCCCCRMGMLK